jgi:hypothetical protein
VLLIVAWTAVHALMFEITWFLPCDWSVPMFNCFVRKWFAGVGDFENPNLL